MRIIFMGTPDLAQTSLKKINEAGYPIIGVVTAPDKPKGRGMKYTMSPVKEYALENHFPVYQPEKIRKNKEDWKIFFIFLEMWNVCEYMYNNVDKLQKKMIKMHTRRKKKNAWYYELIRYF